MTSIVCVPIVIIPKCSNRTIVNLVKKTRKFYKKKRTTQINQIILRKKDQGTLTFLQINPRMNEEKKIVKFCSQDYDLHMFSKQTKNSKIGVFSSQNTKILLDFCVCFCCFFSSSFTTFWGLFFVLFGSFLLSFLWKL